MLFKVLVLLMLAIIIYSLGSGLYFLTKERGKSTKVVKALTWRIGLSILLFLLLLLAYSFGWISPHTV